MQNRFMFRAWNKEAKTMHYSAEETYNGIFGNPKIEHTSFSGLLNDNQYIIMQCTGLKDKTGKLIYEGDVVLFGSNPDDIAVIEWNKDECKFVVDEIFDNAISDFSNWFGEDLEIIGNIYENPDLIGGKKQ